LKIGSFDHADAGQMNMYLNYFLKNEKTEGDNPPVGIILCANKNDALVEYTTTAYRTRYLYRNTWFNCQVKPN
jgi:hypothetical protein